MFPRFVRFATVAATLVLVSAAGVRAQSELQAPDVLVKNVTLEALDIIRKERTSRRAIARK